MKDPLAKASVHLDEWWLAFWMRLGRSCLSAYRHGQLGCAKGAAYSALLSFFPLLTTTAAILIEANAAAVSRVLSNFLFKVVPPGTEGLVLNSFLVTGRRPVWLLVLAAILSVWAASGVMMSMMEGFHAAYGVADTRSFLRKRGTAILLVFCGVFPAVAASALMLFGGRAERELMRLVFMTGNRELTGGLLVLGRLVRYSVALSTVILVTILVYSLGAKDRRRVTRVWPGAFVSTQLWLLATLVFAWYVRNIANYNVLYGGVGAVIALVVWMWVLAVIALVGCEYNAEREREALDKQGRGGE